MVIGIVTILITGTSFAVAVNHRYGQTAGFVEVNFTALRNLLSPDLFSGGCIILTPVISIKFA